MRVTESLKREHRTALGLIEALEGASDQPGAGDARREIFEQLKTLLKTHAEVEEKIFYPAMKEFSESRELVREFHEEHKEIDHPSLFCPPCPPRRRSSSGRSQRRRGE
jgi:hemerythrin-like domain-containing protein